ncbi:hypothetical protein D3C76_983510 [compost metagenome]
MGVGVAEAEREQGRFGQVELGDAVHQRGVRRHAIDPVALVFVVHHQAPTHIARLGQRPRGIEAQAVAVPATGFGVDAELRLESGPLADQVDGRRRRAGAADQPGGATHDFDAVVHGGVLGGVIDARRGRYTVDFEVVDLKTTRPVGVVLGTDAGVRRGDARCLLQHLVEGGELLVVQPLAGHHRQRLWGLLGGQVQPRRAAGRIGGVEPGAFGGRTRRLARDAQGLQLQAIARADWQRDDEAVGIGLAQLRVACANQRTKRITDAERALHRHGPLAA